jgi:hypothetical protein
MEISVWREAGGCRRASPIAPSLAPPFLRAALEEWLGSREQASACQYAIYQENYGAASICRQQKFRRYSYFFPAIGWVLETGVTTTGVYFG